MISNEQMTFKIKGENGQDIECEVLCTFESDETKQEYMIYTDNSVDADGNVKIYASVYKSDEEPMTLKPIETEKEWKMVETILEEIQAQVEAEEAEEKDEQ